MVKPALPVPFCGRGLANRLRKAEASRPSRSVPKTGAASERGEPRRAWIETREWT